MNNLEKIFIESNPPSVPPRVPVREVGQKKPQEVIHKVTQTKSASQSNPFINAKYLRVPIVEAYPYELQPVNPAKKTFFSQSGARI